MGAVILTDGQRGVSLSCNGRNDTLLSGITARSNFTCKKCCASSHPCSFKIACSIADCFGKCKLKMKNFLICNVERSFGFLHPHPSRLRRATFPREGEGLSLRLPILLRSWASAVVRAFPLMGEGGWPQARRMRVFYRALNQLTPPEAAPNQCPHNRPKLQRSPRHSWSQRGRSSRTAPAAPDTGRCS